MTEDNHHQNMNGELEKWGAYARGALLGAIFASCAVIIILVLCATLGVFK